MSYPTSETQSAERFLRGKSKWAHHPSERDAIVTVLDEYDRLRQAEQTILALIERSETESLPAVPADKLRRALAR